MRQQLNTAITHLTTTATSLENAKTGKADADSEMEAAREAATQASTDASSARTAFIAAADGLIGVVTGLRDSA